MALGIIKGVLFMELSKIQKCLVIIDDYIPLQDVKKNITRRRDSLNLVGILDLIKMNKTVAIQFTFGQSMSSN